MTASMDGIDRVGNALREFLWELCVLLFLTMENMFDEMAIEAS